MVHISFSVLCRSLLVFLLAGLLLMVALCRLLPALEAASREYDRIHTEMSIPDDLFALIPTDSGMTPQALLGLPGVMNAGCFYRVNIINEKYELLIADDALFPLGILPEKDASFSPSGVSADGLYEVILYGDLFEQTPLETPLAVRLPVREMDVLPVGRIPSQKLLPLALYSPSGKIEVKNDLFRSASAVILKNTPNLMIALSDKGEIIPLGVLFIKPTADVDVSALREILGSYGKVYEVGLLAEQGESFNIAVLEPLFAAGLLLLAALAGMFFACFFGAVRSGHEIWLLRGYGMSTMRLLASAAAPGVFACFVAVVLLGLSAPLRVAVTAGGSADSVFLFRLFFGAEVVRLNIMAVLPISMALLLAVAAAATGTLCGIRRVGMKL